MDRREVNGGVYCYGSAKDLQLDYLTRKNVAYSRMQAAMDVLPELVCSCFQTLGRVSRSVVSSQGLCDLSNIWSQLFFLDWS